MVEIYKRSLGDHKNVKNSEGVAGVQETSQVILAGTIKQKEDGSNMYVAKFSRKATYYVELNLDDTIVEDPDFGAIVNENKILFFDKKGGKFGDQLDATNAEKKLKSAFGGEQVLVKANKQVTQYEDGTTETTYFGKSIVRNGANTLKFQTNDNGPGCTTLMGKVIVNDDGSVAVPMSAWDKKLYEELIASGSDKKEASSKSNYTVWVNLEGVDKTDERFVKSISDDGQERCAICAFVSSPKAYEEFTDEASGRTIAAKMTPDSIFRIA